MRHAYCIFAFVCTKQTSVLAVMLTVLWMWNIPILWDPSLAHWWKTAARIDAVKTWFGVLLVWPAMTVCRMFVVVPKYQIWRATSHFCHTTFSAPPPKKNSWDSLSLCRRITPKISALCTPNVLDVPTPMVRVLHIYKNQTTILY